MATSSVACDLCDKDHVTKPADGYCPQCDEALCIDCKKYHKLSKATKSHKTITIEEFQRLPPFIRKKKQNCEEHGDPLEFFCPIHDELCCKSCLHLVHKNCNEIVFIPEMVKTTDLSSQLDNLLKTTEDVEQNIKLAIADRQKNITDIEQQRRAIINEVKQKKEEIISHFDKIEERLLKSLSVTYKNIKLQNEKLVNDMASRCEETINLKQEIAAMKRNASDVQLFVGSKKLMKPVASLKQYIKATLENGTLDNTNLVLATNEQTNNITDNIPSLGTVSSTNKPSTVRFEWKEEQSAQMMTLKKRNFDDIRLKSKVKLKNIGNVDACIILSDGNIIAGKVIVDHNRFKTDVMKYTSKGRLISKLLINRTNCYDIVSVNEDTVAVTGGRFVHCIHIINVKTLKVVKVITCDDSNYGATFHDGSLLCCTTDHGIQRIDITTEKCRTIVSGNFRQTYIVTDDSYLYHSDHYTDSVVCYDFSGNTKWTYKDKLLKCPRGITINRNSNVYVAGYDSNNVVVISSDGKQGIQFLCQDDGMYNPISININKERNILLVGNHAGSVYLYDVKI